MWLWVSLACFVPRHGICHGYTDIIRVKYFVFWGKFLLRTYNVLPKIEFFTFLQSFGDTFIWPEAYHGYIYDRNTNCIKFMLIKLCVILPWVILGRFIQSLLMFIMIKYSLRCFVRIWSLSWFTRSLGKKNSEIIPVSSLWQIACLFVPILLNQLNMFDKIITVIEHRTQISSRHNILWENITLVILNYKYIKPSQCSPVGNTPFPWELTHHTKSTLFPTPTLHHYYVFIKSHSVEVFLNPFSYKSVFSQKHFF